jgi:hypothetical protein
MREKGAAMCKKIWFASLLAPAILACAVSDAPAGGNAGGTLTLVYQEIDYTEGYEDYCIEGPCEDRVVEVPASPEPVVIVALASFVVQSELKGITFGIDYPDNLVIVGFGSCGDFEIPQPSWPDPGTGTAVTWADAVVAPTVPVYWFAAYDDDTEPGLISLIPHPTQGAFFGDASVPSQLDPIVCLGAFGFGEPGVLCCAEIAGACCFEDGSCEYMPPDDCAAGGGTYQGDLTLCTPNPCPQPPGACCFPDGTCSVMSIAGCQASGGAAQEPGSSCDPNPCPPPVGACCFETGDCQRVTEEDCAQLGGEYQGDLTSCDPNPCPQPTGACCGLDGACAVTTMQICVGAGLLYLGDGTVCDPNPCPLPPGACCLLDGSCEVLEPSQCAMLGGDYQGNETTCDPNPCPIPHGACCLPDSSCQVLDADVCEASGGDFVGPDIACVPDPCPASEGACCYPDATCLIQTEAACLAAGGDPQGAGVPCELNTCAGSSQPGACCFEDGSCEITLAEDCAGTFEGSPSCFPNPCPQPPVGACCIGADCLIQTPAECAAQGGEYLGDDVPCDPNPCLPIAGQKTSWGRIKASYR